jgi:ribosomal protein L37AE/L43A
MSTPKCYYCERRDNIERQICGFWFCFWCLPRALEKGAYYWARMAGAVGELLSKIVIRK